MMDMHDADVFFGGLVLGIIIGLCFAGLILL